MRHTPPETRSLRPRPTDRLREGAIYAETLAPTIKTWMKSCQGEQDDFRRAEVRFYWLERPPPCVRPGCFVVAGIASQGSAVGAPTPGSAGTGGISGAVPSGSARTGGGATHPILLRIIC